MQFEAAVPCPITKCPREMSLSSLRNAHHKPSREPAPAFKPFWKASPLEGRTCYPRVLNCTCPHPSPLKPSAAGTPQEAMHQLFRGLDWCQYTCSQFDKKLEQMWALKFVLVQNFHPVTQNTTLCQWYNTTASGHATAHPSQGSGAEGSHWTDTACAVLLRPCSASSAFHCQPSKPCSSAAGSWAGNSPSSVWFQNQSVDLFPWTSSLLHSSNPSCMTIIELRNLCLAQGPRIHGTRVFRNTGKYPKCRKRATFFYQLLSWWAKTIPSFPTHTFERCRPVFISYEGTTAQRK